MKQDVVDLGGYVDLGDAVGSGSGPSNTSLSLLWGCFSSRGCMSQ